MKVIGEGMKVGKFRVLGLMIKDMGEEVIHILHEGRKI